MVEARSAIRAARRSDLHAMTDLRIGFLGEAAHEDPRLRLMPDVRARTEQALPVWMGQEDRVLLVATAPPHDDEAPVAGYGMGLLRVVPPILQHRHVGEVLELFVAPAQRGQGLGAALLDVLTHALVGRGAEVLRAAVPVTNPAARERLERAGFAALQLELERGLGAG